MASLLLLLASTLLWSYWSAHIENSNADQLVNPYLFTDWQTFHQAAFPAAHSQLVKWPLFWLVSLTGITPSHLVVWTMLISLLTVAGIAYMLYRIERRPPLLGSWYLLAAILLLLVTPQPYAGSLLPTNFAMLTTRNLEYLIFCLGLFLVIKARRIISWHGLGAMATLGLLFASDQLFLQMSAAGAFIMLFGYALFRKWQIVSLAARWLLITILAAIVGFLLVTVINASHLTHIVATADSSPYGLIQGIKDLLLAIIFGGIGVLSNVGLSPVSATAIELRQLPSIIFHGLASIAGPAYIVVTTACLLAVRGLYGVVRPTLKKRSNARLPKANQFGLLLAAAAVAAFLLFIATDHYYAVDARYLTIWLFTVLGGAAIFYRTKKVRHLWVYAAVLSIGLASAVFGAHHVARLQASAYDFDSQKNSRIVDALTHRHITTLVGDYWRVLPIKLASNGQLTVTPLDSCGSARSTLTSATWQPDLRSHSFAYLLSTKPGLSGFPGCSYNAITKMYGQANSQILISGSSEDPTEELLVYDRGTAGASQLQPTQQTRGTAPISLSELNVPRCSNTTIMNITAHQDDDLLFINPDTYHSIKAGDCIRSVYLTAGDAGRNSFYWINRQLGSEAAYASMLKAKNIWVEQTVKIAPDQYVTVASLHDHPEISLVFFALPDGGIHGDGFVSSGLQSLQRLISGKITTIKSVDGQSSYTADGLVTAIADIMRTYQVGEIRTQANVASTQYPDHSDHIATGQFAALAAVLYSKRSFSGGVSIPVYYYIGYPIHAYPKNVSDADMQVKEDAFMAYAQFDGNVCHSSHECARTPTYGSYLGRQYRY